MINNKIFSFNDKTECRITVECTGHAIVRFLLIEYTDRGKIVIACSRCHKIISKEVALMSEKGYGEILEELRELLFQHFTLKDEQC